MSKLAVVVYPEFQSKQKWLCCSTWFLYDRLIKEFDAIVIDSQETYDRVKGEITAVFAGEFGGPRIKYDRSCKHKIAYTISDPHDYRKKMWFSQYIQDNGIDYILGYYKEPTLRHYPEMQMDKFIHFPWAIPDEMVAEADSIHPKPADISIFGMMGGYAYDVRSWCSKFSFVNNKKHSRNKKVFGSLSGYYSGLQEYDAVVAAGSSILRLVTPKYFEIAGAGRLLFAHHCPDLEDLGFNESNCIIFNKLNFESLAMDYYNQPEKYFERRIKALELIRERHLISNRINMIRELLCL